MLYYGLEKESKTILIIRGGCCVRCGYSKCLTALDFHHINPDEKEFNISRIIRIKDQSIVYKELGKCVILCANCHREEHEKHNVANTYNFTLEQMEVNN